ncbi:MAG: shikimate dehydrogenase [Nitrosomonas sp.]|nr:MAG: shikimate dehydrogenase [Nitrosomonas sp.]
MLDRYIVIGNPISHSKSPFIHTAFAQQTRQAMEYAALLAPLDGFKATVKNFQLLGGKGMNITVPFKLEAYRLSTRLTERANVAQAVNTFRFDGDGILGDNTDGIGLVRDIESNLSIPIEGKRILLLGAGGAARGVILPLLQKKPLQLSIANRTRHKAEALKIQFDVYGNITAGNFTEFSGKKFDIIINATSAGLHDELPIIPVDIFIHANLVYDMMYSSKPTRFLALATQNGASRIADGIGMLVEQAAESFYLWRNIKPQTKPIIALLKALI